MELIGETLDCTFRAIKEIKSQLEYLTLEVSKLSSKDQQLLVAAPLINHPISCQVVPPLLGDVPKGDSNSAGQGSSQHLVLCPDKICLTICSYRGLTPNWNHLHSVTRHLSVLLKINYALVDLVAIEPLNPLNQTQKILLTFTSSRIPSLI